MLNCWNSFPGLRSTRISKVQFFQFHFKIHYGWIHKILLLGSYTPYWKTPPAPLLPSTPVLTSIPPSTPLHDLNECIHRLPRAQYRLLDGFERVASDEQIWRAFRRSRSHLYLASNGGLGDNLVTHGWILSSTGKHVLFRCSGPVDGPYNTNSSTRSKLGGFASALILLVNHSRQWGIRHRCSFKWYTDSRSAISRIRRFSRRRTSRFTRIPYAANLLSLIASHLKESRRPVKLNWVQTHQGNLAAYDSLPALAARLNIDAVFLATRYRKRGRRRPTVKVDHFPAQQRSTYINGAQVTSQHDECIRFPVNGYHLCQYLQQFNGWVKDMGRRRFPHLWLVSQTPLPSDAGLPP